MDSEVANGVRLLAARSEHAEEAADVIVRSREAYLPYAPMVHSVDETRCWMRDVLIPGGGVTLALRGQAIVGVLAISTEAGVGWVDQLYLLPGAPGEGIGSLLLAHALTQLPQTVRLHTFQENTRARRFYEQRGFVPVAFTDGRDNEERCPDVLYEYRQPD
ncbi:MAG: GNAT family N-acetyltransferase [Pseudomonadales bacterium]